LQTSTHHVKEDEKKQRKVLFLTQLIGKMGERIKTHKLYKRNMDLFFRELKHLFMKHFFMEIHIKTEDINKEN
jgi:hypothetical protein